MQEPDNDRVTLRRTAFDLKDEVAALAEKAGTVDPDAAEALGRARSALFSAWTMLCIPPEDEGDEPHDH